MSTTHHEDLPGNLHARNVRSLNVSKENAILVGVRWGGTPAEIVAEHLTELRLLTETAGGQVVGDVVQRRDRPDAATFIGKGKAESLMRQADELGCDLIIFDDDLSPSQQKTLQHTAGNSIKIIDRGGLIIDIFAKHARTKEAKTQVELAQLQYLLPRLTRQWTHLERQMGGIGTRGGPGEAQIETDRRLIRRRINKLKEELRHIASEHDTQSRRRRNTFRAALVGYTNAGKSTLMNALTDADIFVDDRLFATLDTTTRRLQLDENHNILLSDTVGFIRKLPHHLIASFRSTLAEVADADLLLKVIDASSHLAEEHFRTVNEVLQDLGLDEKPSVVVLNKLDAIDNGAALTRLQGQFPEAVVVSARQRLRLAQLEAVILQVCTRDFDHCRLWIPSNQSRLISTVYQTLEVQDRTFEEDVTVLDVWGPKQAIQAIKAKIIEAG
ncbi:MAG: GTPase HflX [Fidelibacterota bacterium]|nr:MAG: GTPase HflX [Candidatus Neomarinimicrobiota bacterium]